MDIKSLSLIGKDVFTEVLRFKNSYNVKEKIKRGASGDVTYVIDRLAEDIIISNFKSFEIPLNIVSEECGILDLQGGSNTRVLIDPIDGSKNAINGLPFFCSSIAIADGKSIGDIYLAYIINLSNGDEFWAQKNKGAFLNGKPIHTHKAPNIGNIFYESQRPALELPLFLNLFSLASRARCYGSLALSLSYMAQSAASLFICPFMSRSFDFAAAYLIAKEAGAIVTDLKGNNIETLETGLDKCTNLLAAANDKIHKKTLDALNNN
ncbi:inositol-phosphate phosphatase [Candidatus Magnetoovum chiemensis]|nr:inositol-phosphate phosphatase [Candidatus Magnetoovum chiemensis]